MLSIYQIYVASTDFLTSLAADKAHTNDVDFCQFRRKLFHVSLSYIPQSLQPGEVTPEIFQCPDGHFRRIIWGIGPYIADYPILVGTSITSMHCEELVCSVSNHDATNFIIAFV